VDKNKLDSAVYSISVGYRLVGTLNIDGNIISLVLGEESELSTERAEVEASNLLVKLLGKHVDLALLVLIVITVDPEINLSNNLVSE
jgi:hypothetical protein